ncbi:hypothetical protein OF83DRAFT_1136129 [Amylostereum chailletii]|nr:hypothetical protein OF83DRAFT_1136129 [Amylostereum chailletii]
MPATRTKDPHDGESSKAGASHHDRPNRRHPKHEPRDSATLGASKLKAALRQTRRLLAKESLAANVRVETERRLKALEADLARAEQANKERTMTVRYRKIKFFDRQKLTRRIKQTKKQLSDETLSAKARKALEATLFELRVDLNYTINYPKTEPYISLFPPEVRQDADAGTAPIHPSPNAELSSTDAKREELREWAREQMAAGTFAAEPESLASGVGHGAPDRGAPSWPGGEAKRGTKKPKTAPGCEEEDEQDALEGMVDEDGSPAEDAPPPSKKKDKSSERRSTVSKRKKSAHTEVIPTSTAEQDDFFGEDD